MNKKTKKLLSQYLSPEVNLSREVIMLTFVPRSDTNAATISVTLHQISVNPEIEAKVRAELREVLPFVHRSDTNAATISVTLHQISVNPEIEAKVRAELRDVDAF